MAAKAPRGAEAHKPWSHNIAYFPFIVNAARERARHSAIDVGTANGMLAAELAEFIPSVVGLDAQAEQVESAAAAHPNVPGLRFVVGDVLTTHCDGEPYDFVACSATLHHMETDAGLNRLRDLTAPGGTLVIVGLAFDSTPWDRIVHIATRVPIRLARARHGWYQHGGPVAGPKESWTEIRRLVSIALPGARFRKRLYWRYSVVWNRPDAT
ncbi:MAG TPA: class I SAM-dependent methyltransferase [Galbitalea sp.]|nr:class I SAM-dependent methyltransferase [Galbitalea sp.]